MTDRIQSTWRSNYGLDSSNGQKRSSGKKLFGFVAVVLLMGVAAGGGYGASWYSQHHRLPFAHAGGAGQQTVAQVVQHVGEHIMLPSGEQPTLATVSDVSKVKGQSFFRNAANGDKVLVYAQAKKAILYRPSTDKVVEIAPLSADQ